MIRTSMLFTSIAAVTVATIVPSSGGNPAHSGNGTQAEPTIQRAVLDSNSQVFEISDEFHGVARPSQEADLPSLVRGTIGVIHVREGQSVRKGSSLLTLDDRVPRAQLASATVKANLTGAIRRAEVEYNIAESRLQRVQQVVSRGAGADFELEEATGIRDKAQAALQFQRDTLKAAEADRQLAQAQLDQFTIAAPFDGVITEIHQKSGVVELSVPLITIVNLTTLEVEMHLPSRLFGSVAQGEMIQLNAGRPVSKAMSATVVSVSPVINSPSDTFRCLLQLENSGERLPAGFNVVLDADTGVSTLARLAFVEEQNR